jgi:uncharacterized glyoxalase superfamily protein PhnB/uncharacterized protein YciI
MNYYALIYHVVDDFVARRAAHRPEHLRLAREAHARGELVLAGALDDPVDQALLVFRAADRSVVERFARADPYVTSGLVTRWVVRPWSVKIGNVVEVEPMSGDAKDTRANVIPTLRYRDAAAAIDWLCEAFGFERLLVVPGEGGTIAHAQLVFGSGMIMLGSARDDEYGRLVKPPKDPGASNTQSPYIVVQDADRHYARAVAAGATIVMDIKDEDYGGRGYSCRDPEGHVWNFGTYDPWAPAKPS